MHQIKPQKNYHNRPKKRGTTLWHIILVATTGGRFVRVNDSGKLQEGEIGQTQQLIRSITPQAAARRFIKKRLPVLAVLQDDGANEPADALGGHSRGGMFRKIGEANRYRRGRMRQVRGEMGADTGGTYGIKVVYG